MSINTVIKKINEFSASHDKLNHKTKLKDNFIVNYFNNEKLLQKAKGNGINASYINFYSDDKNKIIHRHKQKHKSTQNTIYYNNKLLINLEYLSIEWCVHDYDANKKLINFVISNKLKFANLKIVEIKNFNKKTSQIMINKFKNVELSCQVTNIDHLSNAIQKLIFNIKKVPSINYLICSLDKLELIGSRTKHKKSFKFFKS